VSWREKKANKMWLEDVQESIDDDVNAMEEEPSPMVVNAAPSGITTRPAQVVNANNAEKKNQNTKNKGIDAKQPAKAAATSETKERLRSLQIPRARKVHRQTFRRGIITF